MAISSTSAASSSMSARLLQDLMGLRATSGGQKLPESQAIGAASGPPPGPPPGGGPRGPRSDSFATDTLSSLLDAQTAASGPPASSDLASQLIGDSDTDGDGALSLGEITSALGTDQDLSKLFGSLDGDGDGSLSSKELTSALDDMKTRHAQGHHHGPPSSSDIAGKLIGDTDSNGDGALSLSEITSALGTSSDLSSTFGGLDSDANGSLSSSELSTALDAMMAKRATSAYAFGASQTASAAVMA